MQGNGCLNYPLLQSGSCLCKSAWHPPRWEDHAEDLQQVYDTSAATYSSHSEFSPHIYQIRLGLQLQDRNWTSHLYERQHGLIMRTGNSTKGSLTLCSALRRASWRTLVSEQIALIVKLCLSIFSHPSAAPGLKRLCHYSIDHQYNVKSRAMVCILHETNMSHRYR